MDNILSFISLLTILLGGIGMYTPWLQLRNSKRLTGKELSKAHPDHKWMRWGYLLLYLGWLVLVYVFFTQVLPWINMASFLAAIFASIGLFIGLFAVITGVSILPTRSPWIIFVVGDEAESAGRFQVTWSIGVLLLAMMIEILRR